MHRRALFSLAAGLLAAMCAVSNVLAGPACAVPPAGVVSWYDGDDRADDLVGFHHGVLVNGASHGDGRVGRAFAFDGVDDAVQTDVLVLEEQIVGGDFSLEFWALPRSPRTSLAEAGSGTSAEGGQRFAVFPEDGGVEGGGIGVSLGSNGVTLVEHGDAHFAPTLVFDTPILDWVHIAVVYADRTPTLYVDGVAVRVGSPSLRTFVFASWRNLGTDPDDAGHIGFGAYHGELDELTVYDRALDAADVAAIHAAGAQGKCRPACSISFPGVNTDAWDSMRGAVVLSDSGMRETVPGSGIPISFARDAFGALDTVDDPGVASFRVDAPQGTVHFIEWRSLSPIRIENIQLQAAHRNLPGDPGGFDRVRLFGRDPDSGQMQLLYASEVALPFPIASVGNSRLERCLALRPRPAQEFRIEFTQAGFVPGARNGPELFELNGDGSVTPAIFRDGFEQP